MGQKLISIRSYNNRILDLEATSAELIIRYLHTQYHAGLQYTLVTRREGHIVVQFQANGMTNMLTSVMRNSLTLHARHSRMKYVGSLDARRTVSSAVSHPLFTALKCFFIQGVGSPATTVRPVSPQYPSSCKHRSKRI